MERESAGYQTVNAFFQAYARWVALVIFIGMLVSSFAFVFFWP